MDEKEIEVNEESIENTKEVKTLKDLSIEALDNMETLYMEEFDSQRETAEELFQEEVEQLEETQMEQKESLPEKEEKESFLSKIKKKWAMLSQKQKALIIGGILLVFVLLFVVLYFCFVNKNEEEPKKEPDVILKSDNYRYENGTLVFLEGETELGSYECKNKDEKLCAVAFLNLDDTLDGVRRVDEYGKKLTLRSEIYEKRYVFLIDHEKSTDSIISLYDIVEKKVIKNFSDVILYPEYKEYVILKDEEGNFGLEKISLDGITTVIPYTYEYIGLLPSTEALSRVVVKDKNNNSYIASLENKILTKATTSTIVGANESYFKTKDASNKYHIFESSTGNEVLADLLLDYASLLDQYVLYVHEEKLYAVDYKGNKMSLEGIELYNDSYNPVETYKDYKLNKITKSYDYELVDQKLNINRYIGTDVENVSLNLLEGNLSAKIPYMSYFDGKLILYADEAKREIVGEYSCKNYNVINKDTSKLEKCFLAKDSFYHETRGNSKEEDQSSKLGTIPVANKRFIFIQDGDQIVLYDLVDKKEIALYKSVDTGSYTNSEDVKFETPKNAPFIAVSANSSKFGVASITESGVSPILKFEYNSIKKLGDYYVVESDEGFKLYQLNGAPVDMEFKRNPIVDYNGTHLKTIDSNNNYFVHGFKEDYKDSYNYVELYGDFYAGVVNNRVHLYRYDDKDKIDYLYDEKEEEKGLKLNVSDYSKAFKITINKDEIIAEIASSTGTFEKHTFSTSLTKPDEPNDQEENDPKEDEKEE